MTKIPKRVFSAALAVQTAFLCGLSAHPTCFVLKEDGGKIVLFQEGEPQPIAVYEKPGALYPADEELLREGIRVKSETEITRLIEDLDLE